MKMNQREDPAGRTLSFGEWAGDGSVSCRQVDRNGFVIVWTARWKVLEISKDNEKRSADLSVSGCGEELDIHLELSQAGVHLSIRDLDVSCQLGMPGDAGKNVRLLETMIGTRDALTVCSCVRRFADETGWGENQ